MRVGPRPVPGVPLKGKIRLGHQPIQKSHVNTGQEEDLGPSTPVSEELAVPTMPSALPL